MSARSNACSELARFWLQERHGCLIDEGLMVPVPYALSDIDLVALRGDLTPFALPDGLMIGPRLIVETKAEHDWDASGREFGAALRNDVSMMVDGEFIPSGARGVKFTMLREQHYERAAAYFGTTEFDRVFVVHALDPLVRAELEPFLVERRIFWLTVPEVVADIYTWYQTHPRRAALRRSATGDLLHMLFGLCRFGPTPPG